MFQRAGNDQGVSTLTLFFYKALFKEAAETHPADDDLRVLLRHASKVWFPKTLGSLENQ